MKKLNVFLLALLVIFISCKDEIKNEKELSTANYAQIIESNDKSSMNILGVITVGHPENGCPGCVTINGITGHMDCMGRGTACSVRALYSIQLKSKNLNYYEAFVSPEEDLTSEDYFLIPNRSIEIENPPANNKRWFNIPEQMLYRDTILGYFTINNIRFSSAPLYFNE